MISETKTRVRPQTTASRLNRVRIVANMAGQSRRRAKSARARIKTSEDPPPDLIPPEWTPLICEMTPDIISNRPDSGYETQDGAARSTGSDDETDDFSSRQSTPGPLSGRTYVDSSDTKTESPTSRIPYSEANPPKPLKRPQTNAQLKDFLAAAMDSVRFFLMTSSVGEAHKEEGEGEGDQEDIEENDNELGKGVPQYNRAKLLIMNGALMEPPWRFSIETYKDDPEMLQFYTGFRSYDLIKSIFHLLKPCPESIPVWAANDSPENVREGAFKTGIITLLDEFFMFLYKLRHNPSTDDLSVRFSMPQDTVQHILDDWLHYLYGSFGQKPVWPSRENVDVYMQQCYKSVCPCARIIVHVAKVKVRLPRDLPTKESITDVESETEAEVNEPEDIPEIPTEDNTEALPKPDASSGKPMQSTSFKVTAVSKLAAIRGMKQSTRRMSSVKKADKKEQKIQQQQKQQNTEQKRARKKPKEVKQVNDDGIQPDSNDVKHYKSVVIFQPTGAACMVSKLYPASTPSEEVLAQMGVFDMLDECDDVVTVDSEDDLRHDVMEELLHPHAANYMNMNFLTGCLPWEEFKRKSPMKAHRVKCMHWHIYHSIDWVRKMKIWDELAELPPSWVEHVERVWTVCCLMTNFMPSDPCLDITEEFPNLNSV